MPQHTYKGSITTTGSSEAFRFDKVLFRQNPEFRQKVSVQAHVIGRGTLLVHLAEDLPDDEHQDDPMVAAFLSFLERDATAHPDRITPLSSSKVAQAMDLTKGITVADHDEIPEDVSF